MLDRPACSPDAFEKTMKKQTLATRLLSRLSFFFLQQGLANNLMYYINSFLLFIFIASFCGIFSFFFAIHFS